MLRWLLSALLALLIGAFTLLQLPYVQNRLFTKLLQQLSHTTQFTITHQHFQLKWLYHASLTGLTIKDPQDKKMLAVAQLSLKVNPLQLLRDRFVTLKTISIRSAQVHLRKESKAGYNLSIFLRRLLGDITPAPSNQQSAPFFIERASLQDIELSTDDQQTALLKDKFDYNHLRIHQIQAKLANLKAQANKFEVDIRHLACKHVDRPFFIDHFSTALVVAPDSVKCKALNLQTGSSTLRGSCTVTYDPSASPTEFYNSAHITAYLDSTTVAAEELGIFVPYFKQHKTSYSLCGTLEGKLNDFHIKDFQLAFGERGNHLKGSLSLRGLPKLQETVFNLELKQGMLYTKDLRPYLDEKRYKLIEEVASVKTQGHIYGKKANFIAKATFDTDLGKISTDLEFQIDPVSQLATYKGAFATQDLELGTWLDNRAVQKLGMQGQIDGKGLSLATAHFQLEANIDKLGFNNYEYENIYTKGAFTQAFFQGQITVDDPNLKLQADAVIDLSNDSIAIQGALDRAYLQALQLTDTHATLNTKLSLTLQGLSLDNIKLDAQLNRFCFGLADRQVQLDALHIRTDQDNLGKLLELDSELFAFKAKGDFAYTTLASDLNQFLQGFQRRLRHAAPTPSKNTLRPYTLAYQIHCKDINPLLRVFITDVYVAPGAKLEGSFSQNEATTFSLKLAEVDTLAFKQLSWKDIQLALFASQTKDSQAVSAKAQLASKEQCWGTISSTEDLAFAVSWENDQISFSSTFSQNGGHNQLNVQGYAVLLDTTIELVLSPSSIKLSDHQWQVHPENRIIIGKSWTQFQNFEFVSAKQQVSLNGVLSADPGKVLHLKVKNFSLDNLNLLVGKQLTGELNATAVLQGMLGQPHIDSKLTLEELTIDKVLVGDVCVQTNWNDALKRLNLTGQVDYLAKQAVAIQGFYEPLQGENSLQLKANFSHAQLAALEPLVDKELSQLAGELSGTIDINGSPSSPRITGEASITDAALKINYLNAFYQASGKLTFADQLIRINELNLTDDQQGKAVFQGRVTHQGFEGFHIDLTGSMTQFKLLDTTIANNEYFYGTGILSGSLTLAGPLSDPAIHMKSKTSAGTSIYIPISTASNTVTQERFIRFVDFKTKYQDKASRTRQLALKGLKLTMLLEITPEAHTELILDAASGNVIKGRGKGNLKIAVDTEGALSIAGGFEFSEGECSFSLYRIVKKPFKILPKSKITWTDSPYEGVLDVKAAYEQRATLTPLLKAIEVIGRDEAKKKYPVQVLVTLRGGLLSPDMHYQVNFLEYPSNIAAQTAISDFQNRAEEDELYLKSQVVSLVMFKGFAEAKLTDTSSGTVSRSLSELVSRQLGSLASNLDEKLEVDTDVDLEELGNKGLEGVRFKISRSFLDGRLRVAGEGGLGVGTANVEYFLTQDGRLRAKLYNKHVPNPTYLDTDRPTASSGGFSLLYTRSFNQFLTLNFSQFWELLFGDSNKEEKREAQEAIEER